VFFDEFAICFVLMIRYIFKNIMKDIKKPNFYCLKLGVILFT